LLDTPGILQPRFEDDITAMNLALTNAIKQEILPIHEMLYGAVRFLCTKYPRIYKDVFGDLEIDLSSNEDIEVKVSQRAQELGFKDHEGYDRFVSKLLYDLREGILGNVSFD
jgi:ribosome biogenesis GTPase A